MADNRIEVIASLDYQTSLKEITSQLNSIQDNINNNGGLKINVAINNDIFKNIQTQIANASKQINNNNINVKPIDVKINTAQAQQSITQLNNATANAIGSVKTVLANNQEAIRIMGGRLQQSGVDENYIDGIKQRLQNLDVVISKIIPKFTGLGSAQKLTSLNISGIDAFGNSVEYIERFSKKNGEFLEATTKIVESLKQVDSEEKKVKDTTQSLEKAYTKFLELSGRATLLSKNYGQEEKNGISQQLSSINELVNQFNKNDSLTAQQQSLIKISNAIKLVVADIQQISFDKAIVSADNLSRKLTNLQNKFTDVNASKPITNADNINKLSQVYNTAVIAVENLRKANKDTFNDLNNEAQSAVDNYNNLATQLRNAETAATKLRAKPISVIKVEQQEAIDAFIAKIGGSGIKSVEELTKKAEQLKVQLNGVKDAQGIRGVLDELSKLKAQFNTATESAKAFNKINSQISNSISQLNNLTNNATFAKNGITNVNISQFANVDVDAVIAKYQELSVLLGKAKTPEQIINIRKELELLEPEFDKIIKSSKDLQQQLSRSSKDTSIENKFKKLSAEVANFEKVNNRAITSLKTMSDGKTFAQGWNDIKNALSKADLSADQLKHVNEQLGIFKKEANTAGLTSSKFLNSLNSQLGMMIRQWVSIYALVGYIRKMVDNVKDLDNAMINLQRVTSATNAEYKEFLRQATAQATALKTTTSELTEQAYQWSKLGYEMNEALKLAGTSTMFAKVADISDDTAQQTLVTTMKAYRLEAESALDISDKIDKLNNEYAVSASGLAEGLTRSASAMAMTGNSLEQNLALLTGIGEVTQDLDAAGNAIKIFALRLQNMKGKLEELGEPVEDLQEVSKVQTQILNLTQNRVNIFDQTTQEFRSTYDILKDIADVWDSLASTQRANLTEILFGKNRANQGLALIQAFQSGQIEKAYTDALNAMGTSTTEYEKMMDGLQGKINGFKQAFEELSNTMLTSDFLKSVVVTGQHILEILNSIISSGYVLPVILGTIGGWLTKFILSGGLVTMLTKIATGIGNIVTALKASQALVAGLGIGAIIASATYLISLFVKMKKEKEELEQAATERSFKNATMFSEEVDDLESLVSRYTELVAKTKDLNDKKTELENIQNTLIDTYNVEADKIDLVNGKYSEQLELIRQAKKEKAEQFIEENEYQNRQQIKYLNFGDENIEKDFNKTFTKIMNKYSMGYGRAMNANGINLAKSFFNSEGLNGNAKEQLDAINEIIKLMETGKFDRLAEANGIVGYSIESSDIESLYQIRDALSENISKAEDFTNAMSEAYGIKADYSIPNDIQKQFNTLIDNLTSTYQKINDLSESNSNVFDQQTEINSYDEIYNSLLELTDAYPSLREQLDETTTAFKNNGKSASTTLLDAKEAFQQFRNSMQDTKQGIDDIEKFMQDIANGDFISSNDFWKKLIPLDTEGILTDIRSINGEYEVSIEQMIKLKDSLINNLSDSLTKPLDELKRKLPTVEKELKDAEKALRNYSVNSNSDVARYHELTEARNAARRTLNDYNSTIKQEQLLIDELNTHLGNTINLTEALIKSTEREIKVVDKQIKGIQAQIDAENNKLKAQLEPIEKTIERFEQQKESIQESKEQLEEQLSILEEQKTQLEKIIDNYNTVESVVEKTVSLQTDELEKQRKQIEDDYNSQINALKEIHDQKEEENSLVEKELKMQEKLKALEDARRNKNVRSYSSERGWFNDIDREAVDKAQSEYDDAVSDYNKTLDEQSYNKQIQALENARDKAVQVFDDEIKAYEEYVEKWKAVLTAETDAENERLANQILGVDWREKIKNKDTNILNKFSGELSSYNSQLNNLVNNEIKKLEDSIKAKEKEIKAIDKQIQAQNKYKSELEKATKSITDDLQKQIDALNNYRDTLQETLTDQQETLKNYQTEQSRLLGQLNSAIEEHEKKTNNALWGIEGGMNQSTSAFIQHVGERIAAMQALVTAVQNLSKVQDVLSNMNSSLLNPAKNAINNMLGKWMQGFSEGGTVDYTGLAMVHGTKTQAETVFNAGQSKSLYDMVSTGQFSDIVANKAVLGLNKAMSTKTTNNSNAVTLNIDKVVADNPQSFVQQLDGYMNAYWKNKLNASYVRQ